MKIQHQNHQKTHNFSYKTEIQFIPVSEIFDVNHFKINEPILIVKFNSHCIETSQVDEKSTQQTTKNFVFQGLLFKSQIIALEKNPESFMSIFQQFEQKSHIYFVHNDYCNAFRNFGINTSMSEKFDPFIETQKIMSASIFDIVSNSNFKPEEYTMIQMQKNSYRTTFVNANNEYFIEPIPFNYIDGGVHNMNYDLEKFKVKLLETPNIIFDIKTGYSKHEYFESENLTQENQKNLIQEIPYYNQDENRTHFLSFYWKPDSEMAKKIMELPKDEKFIRDLNVDFIYDWRSYLIYEFLNGKNVVSHIPQ